MDEILYNNRNIWVLIFIIIGLIKKYGRCIYEEDYGDF